MAQDFTWLLQILHEQLLFAYELISDCLRACLFEQICRLIDSKRKNFPIWLAIINMLIALLSAKWVTIYFSIEKHNFTYSVIRTH